ncbi:MAG: CHASE2 domain-containing protein [Treponema sp.]|nr:CHASE2 domain-containing protein [Treponema sp.]
MIKVKHKNHFVKITLAVFFTSLLLFFTVIDNKLFDFFLRFLPSLAESEKIIVLTLDDDSINYAGGFPFRREVMADIVILLKEFGVETIVFDLNYLDESPYRLDPNYASDVFGQYLHSGFSRLNEAAISVIDGIGPYTEQMERDLYKREIRALHNSIMNELESSIAYLIRDVDEYFANALAFSGCSWLTLTMIRQEDLWGDSGYFLDADINDFLSENITSKNVIGLKDTKTPEMAGVMPAIQKLLTRARGAGFVNAIPDRDGLRRRVNLLLKYQGEYYPQLAFAAMLEKLGVTSVEVTNKTITLKNDNETLLRIPRAQDGSLLIKWPKKNFYDYRMMSLVEFVQYSMIEPFFAQNLMIMQDAGFFMFWENDLTPCDYYLIAEELKNNAFLTNEAACENWLSAKREFIESSDRFLNGNYERQILNDVGDDKETALYVREMFEVSRDQLERLKVIRKKANILQDSFCIIGVDATSMTDNGLITFQENYPLVGTYSTIANMLYSGEFLNDAPWIVSALIALVYSLLLGFIISRLDTHLSIIAGVSGVFLLGVIFISIFMASRVYIGFAVPLAATSLTFISLMIGKFLTVSAEKTFLHNAFSRYLAPEVITEIINNPDKLNLGGEKREMTAIFTDIQYFTTISEQIEPAQLVKLLNNYLTIMSNVIMENLGTIDKYQGDAIMAFWGAPLPRDDHAVLACRSALTMKEAEKALNKTIVKTGLSPVPIFTRIGINTGDMIVGNMGAEYKMDYTIMGLAVNIASRLEGVNKQYSTGGILISEYTRAKIGEFFLLRRLDRVRVVGIQKPLRVYELLAENNGENYTGSIIEMLEIWENAVDLYEGRDFKASMDLFEIVKNKYPDDKVAQFYAKRCLELLENPPPDEWNAINNITEK